MPPSFRSFLLAGSIALIATTRIADAQARPAQAAPARGDAVIDGLKFHPVGGFIQVVDVDKSISAGTILFPPNQPPVFAAMPGYDAKMKAAYEKYVHGDSAAPSEKAAESPEPAKPAAPAFDPATKTATLADGRSVTFLDNDNLKVQMPGPAGPKIYDLRFHKASAGGFMRGVAGSQQGRVGGSAGGGGVTMTLESQNGMPGGEIYDTAKGTVYASSGFQQAKLITAAVREATKVADQESLTKLPVVHSLLTNNLGL